MLGLVRSLLARSTVVGLIGVSVVIAGSSAAEAGFDPGDLVVIDPDPDHTWPNRPDVAFNPERDEYLAVYTVSPNDPVMVRLDAEGRPLGPAAQFGDRHVDPFKGMAVAYQPATNQYLIVWTDFVAPGSFSIHIQGQLVSDLGVAVGPELTLSPPFSVSQCYHQGVELESNLVTGGYTLVYVRHHPGQTTDCDGNPSSLSEEQMYIAALNGSAAVTTRVRVPTDNEVTNIGPDLASNPTNGQFLVGEFDRETDRYISHIYSSDLTLVDSVLFDIPTQSSSLANRYSRTYAAADERTGNWTIVASSFPQNLNFTQTMSSTGAIVIPPTPITTKFEILHLAHLGDGTFVIGTGDRRILHMSQTGAVSGEAQMFGLSTAVEMGLAVDTTRPIPRVMTIGRTYDPNDRAVSRYADVITAGTVPLTPARILDTRRPNGETVDEISQRTGTARAGSSTVLQVTDRAGVPPDAKAVVLNVTAVRPTSKGFLTVYPCGTSVPDSSNLNYEPGANVPNSVFARVGTNGRVCIYTSADTEILADVNGYVPASGLIAPLVPARLLDTRTAPSVTTIDGRFLGGGRVAAGSVTRLEVRDRGGVETPAQAALVNVTSVNGLTGGFLTVYSCDAPLPDASNLNAPAGANIANLVFTKISASGEICIFSSASTHLLVDVNGYAPAGAGLDSVTPARLFDGRPSGETDDGQFQKGGRIAPNSVTEVPIAGRGGVPDGASSAVLNVTAVGPSTNGFFTVYPCDETLPNTSNLNFVAGQNVANFAAIKLSAAGEVCVYTTASTHLLVDVTGYGG